MQTKFKLIRIGRDEKKARVVSELDLMAAMDGLNKLSALANEIKDAAEKKNAQARIASLASVCIFAEKLLNTRLINGIVSDGLFFGTLEPNQEYMDLFFPGLGIDSQEKTLTNESEINKVPH